MNELPQERTKHAKVYDLGGGKRRVHVASEMPLHVPSDYEKYNRGEKVDWIDIDETFDENPTSFVMRNGWFGLEISKTKVEWIYTSKIKNATVSYELIKLDDLPVLPSAVEIGNELATWANVAEGLDIAINFNARRGLTILRELKTPAAPKKFEWKIINSKPKEIELNYISEGHDNVGRLDPERNKLHPGTIVQSVIMNEPQIQTTRGVTIWAESWTGDVRGRNKDRVYFVNKSPVYPVRIAT